MIKRIVKFACIIIFFLISCISVFNINGIEVLLKVIAVLHITILVYVILIHDILSEH